MLLPTHDEVTCPVLAPANHRSEKPLGINQQRILYRLEADKKRHDERKSSRNVAPRLSHIQASLSSQDLRLSLNDKRAPTPKRLDKGVWIPRTRRIYPPQRNHEDHPYHPSPSLGRSSSHQKQRMTQAQQEGSPSVNHWSPATWENGTTVGFQTPSHLRALPQGPQITLQRSLTSHTPSPSPPREGVSTPLDVVEDTNSNSRDRRTALERLSLPFNPELRNTTVGSSLDSERLQEVAIGLIDEDHRNHYFIPDVIQTEDTRIPISLRLGPAEPSNSNHKGKKKAGGRVIPLKPTTKETGSKVSKAVSNKRGNHSPLQGLQGHLRTTRSTGISSLCIHPRSGAHYNYHNYS
ncbi:unnamed protein product [Arabis nemorensis]|uniref:Uncharacterized protein n=1 Tax=Arabis nemorensis TaxID=586526 RepID=A0A565BQ61_9BRAS|nr:unnamed protein product [Arabis nemorensis]